MNNEIIKMRLNHLGEIGFRLALFGFITGAVILLSSFISFFIVAIIGILGIFLPLITLGMIFVVYPNYFSDYTALLNNTTNVINFFLGLTYIVKYIAFIGIIGAIIGSIFLLFDRNNRHWGKFSFCIISIITCLLLFVLIISGSYNQLITV